MKYNDFVAVNVSDFDDELFDKLDDYLYEQDRLYANGKPILTDSQYDELLAMAKKLEPEFGSVKSLSGVSDFIQGDVEHKYPMLSLDKTKSIDELSKFLDKFSDNPNELWYTDGFIVQHKEDGLTVVIDYTDGKLTLATRGDGQFGIDITDNLKSVLSDVVFDKNVTIRCEAIIDNVNFEKINTSGEYQNARNLVSGTIMKKDSNISKSRGVKLQAYTIENALELGIETELESLEYLDNLLPNISKPLIPNSKKQANGSQPIELLTKAEVIDLVKGFNQEMRDAVGHDIDGLVIKPNYASNRDKIGYTSHHPRNQIAFKFESPNSVTTLREVRWQIGASGQYTPVGVFDPIMLGGAMVSQASLANLNNIKERDIRLGDTIIVQRSNDVIPQIIKPVYEDVNDRNSKTQEIEIPSNAHIVGGLVFAKEETLEQKINQWVKFASKKAMDIRGLSKETITRLHNGGVIDINDLSSLYCMDKAKFTALEGLGDKSWENIQSQIEMSKKAGIEGILPGLSIDMLGTTLSNAIADVVDSFDELIQYKDDLSPLNIEGLGTKKKESLEVNLFSDDMVGLLRRLESYGVSLKSNRKKHGSTSSNNDLDGISFVITGKLSKSRDEFKQWIESRGGKVSSSVTGKTDYLIQNEASKSSKSKKAKELGVDVINEDEFNLKYPS